MSKKTLKVQFTITINNIENIPELCIGMIGFALFLLHMN